MSWVDGRVSVQREWQALYGIGLVLAAYAAGEGIGEDGFLAAFAAGLAVSLSSRTLCDCFLEFGEVLAELLMLLSFVLFGAILSSELAHVDLGPALALAALSIFLFRPLSVGAALSLRRNQLSPEARAFLAWFGPRGLNSLLLALIVVESGVAEGQEIFGIAGVVVLFSVAVHGITATPLTAWYVRRVEAKTLPEEQESTIAGVFRRLPVSADEVPRISARDLKAALNARERPVILDVRARNGYAKDPFKIPGAIPLPPDEVADWGREADRDRLIALYCT
jgi:NhaP-type Na+/H+ or K+/H+ antiporter